MVLTKEDFQSGQPFMCADLNMDRNVYRLKEERLEVAEQWPLQQWTPIKSLVIQNDEYFIVVFLPLNNSPKDLSIPYNDCIRVRNI